METLTDDSDLELGWIEADGLISELFNGQGAYDDADPPGTVHIQFHQDQAYRFVRRSDGCHVEVADVELAARMFWLSRLRNPNLIDFDPNTGAATTSGFAVLFRDGTWDVRPGYQPDATECAFWSAVAARFAQLPVWLFS